MGHSFGKYESNNDAVCTKDGTETAKCIRCDATQTRIYEESALGHSFTNYINDGNSDCTHDGTETAICDNGCRTVDTRIVEGTALGHSFTDYVTIFEVTCTVNGMGNGLFGVGAPLSREQLAVILYRYAEAQGIDISDKADLSYCDDADNISTWADDACAWSIKAGLLDSTSETDNLISPKMTVTRAQAAKIFMSFDAYKNK